MRKTLPLLIVAVAGLLIIGSIGLTLFRATQRVPQFYEEALAEDPANQAEGSDGFLQQATALISDMQQSDHWQALFTADQINGWLAVDVPRNFPTAIPPEVQNPRLVIDKHQATVACRFDGNGIHAVVSLAIDVFVCGPNEIAVRFNAAHIGTVPVPMGKLTESIGRAAAEMDMRLEWRQQDGVPVAIIAWAPPDETSRRRIELEAIELREGEVLIAGRTGKARSHESTKPMSQPADEPVAHDSDELRLPEAAAATKTNRQR